MMEQTESAPSMFSLFIKLMKLRVIVLLQITAICAILVHDSLARYDLIDIERTWFDTLWTSTITVIGGTLSAGGSNAINMWYDRDIDTLMRRTQHRPLPQGHLRQQRFFCLVSPFQYWVHLCFSYFTGRLLSGLSFQYFSTSLSTPCG
jgi:heme O synthase-like polyprenyltransferase